MADSESPDALESSLTYALLWIDRLPQSASGAKTSALRLILPKGKSTALTHRLASLGPRCPVVLYELDPLTEKLERLILVPAPIFQPDWFREEKRSFLPDRAAGDIASLLTLAPDAINHSPNAQTGEVMLRFRGLPFARWQDGRIFFDLHGL